jgi:hypothetical protein
MRPQTQGIMLLAFGRDPHIQKVAGEHVAFEQEIVILLQAIQRLGQAARDDRSHHLGHSL